jgi:hypothetical protein
LEFLEPLETIERTAVNPPTLSFVQLAGNWTGNQGISRPSDGSGRPTAELKALAPLWKDINRDVLDSNQFRRALHPPPDTYEPYNPPAEEGAADFEDRPVAASYKPGGPWYIKETDQEDRYDVQHRGW